MNWMFITDLIFYALLGIMFFPLLVMIVAQFNDGRFRSAYRTVKRFLTDWAAIPGKDFMDLVIRVSGVSTVVLVLAFGAYVANKVGDTALPRVVPFFGYLDNDEVRWSAEQKCEFNDLIWNFREVTGIRGDRIKWEEAKVAMGRYDVRFFRAAAVVFFVLLLSTIAGYVRRHRGTVFMTLSAALLAVLCTWLWVDREGKFIENVMGRYVSEHVMKHYGAPKKPLHYKGEHWPAGGQGRSDCDDEGL